MIDLECPNCARRGSVPNDKVSTRLVCKKCHVVFHMTPTGRPMIGEPPSPVKEKAKKPAEDSGLAESLKALKQTEWVDSLFEVNRVKVLFIFLVVGIVGIGCLAVMAAGGKDDLTRKAERVAAAVPTGDQSVVLGLVKSESAERAATWFETVRMQYEAVKRFSAGNAVHVSIFVMEENLVKQQGQVVIFLLPAAGSTRDHSIVKAARASPDSAALAIPQVMTFWVLDNGSWRIDMDKTAEAANVRH